MEQTFRFDTMAELLLNLSEITGIRFALLDADGKRVSVAGDSASFCSRLMAHPEGSARCEQCILDAVNHLDRRDGENVTFRCHAGVFETVIALRANGRIAAYVAFGQMLSDEDKEDQWRNTSAELDWYPNVDRLKGVFRELRQCSSDTVESVIRLIRALAQAASPAESVVNRYASMSDEQRLSGYLSEHYSKQISLDDIADALSMSKSKLCALAAKQGTTVVGMINSRRMEEAKRLFRTRNERIADVAARVGIPDFNYFTKLFKAYTGKTPSAYRKQFRAE